MVERFLYFIWPYAAGAISFLIGCALIVIALWSIPYTGMSEAKNMTIALIIGSTFIGTSIGVVWEYGINRRKEFWRNVKTFIIMMLQTVFPWPLSNEDWQIIHWMRRAVVFVMLICGMAFLHEWHQWNFNHDLYTFIRMSLIEKYFLLFAMISPFGGAGLLLLPDVIRLLQRRKI